MKCLLIVSRRRKAQRRRPLLGFTRVHGKVIQAKQKTTKRRWRYLSWWWSKTRMNGEALCSISGWRCTLSTHQTWAISWRRIKERWREYTLSLRSLLSIIWSLKWRVFLEITSRIQLWSLNCSATRSKAEAGSPVSRRPDSRKQRKRESRPEENSTTARIFRKTGLKALDSTRKTQLWLNPSLWRRMSRRRGSTRMSTHIIKWCRSMTCARSARRLMRLISECCRGIGGLRLLANSDCAILLVFIKRQCSRQGGRNSQRLSTSGRTRRSRPRRAKTRRKWRKRTSTLTISTWMTDSLTKLRVAFHIE